MATLGEGGRVLSVGTDRIRTARMLILPELVRAIGGPMMLVFVARGELPAAFAVPFALAALIGITALPLARSLRTGGVLAWGLAVAWNVVALVDLAVGWGDVLTLSPPLFEQIPYRLMPTVFGPIFLVLHVWCLAILLRPEVRWVFAARDITDSGMSAR